MGTSVKRSSRLDIGFIVYIWLCTANISLTRHYKEVFLSGRCIIYVVLLRHLSRFFARPSLSFKFPRARLRKRLRKMIRVILLK